LNIQDVSSAPISPGVSTTVRNHPADALSAESDVFITDPPYADAVSYEEITEYFIAWLRKSPPPPFRDWIWDSRRDLAIRGSGEEFRREMVKAYTALANHMPDNGMQIVMFTHQDARVWGDMAGIFWAAGLRVTAAWYIATETTSELKKGGYVQGTVVLILRKRTETKRAYKDELVLEVREEVKNQLETMIGLNQQVRARGRSENLFEDADLQMAGYAAALRVLTGYTGIDGIDMTREALRPRTEGERTVVDELIEFAVAIANEELVPDGLDPKVWEKLVGAERFYLRMLDLESTGLKKLDNYQNFAKAFRVRDWQPLMGSMKPNDARLKAAREFKRTEFGESEFGSSLLRAILYALYELEAELETDEVMSHLRDNVKGYFNRRSDIVAVSSYLASKLERIRTDEAGAARVLRDLVKGERLGA
jgi:adenine-specific DNA methylase